jgi:hypothetical protein
MVLEYYGAIDKFFLDNPLFVESLIFRETEFHLQHVKHPTFFLHQTTWSEFHAIKNSQELSMLLIVSLDW